MFGGIERQSKKCFFEIVEDRSAKTLIPIITKYVKPGTVILSDCWKAYSTLKDEGYSEIDNNVYCVCTHDISLCTHRKFTHVRTTYAVKISGTQTVFGFMRT